MDNKGLFWGTNGAWSGVKIFGIENFWGNIWRRIAGCMYISGTQKVKMTYGQSDGSTTDGYNIDGTGYIEIPDSAISGSSEGYINKMKFTKNGFLPLIASGSSTTKYCDGLFFAYGITYMFFGGASNLGHFGSPAGCFCFSLNTHNSIQIWNGGASISCKPLAPVG